MNTQFVTREKPAPIPITRIRAKIAEYAPGYNARHVEAFMLAAVGGLELLTDSQLQTVAQEATADIRLEGESFAESLAVALGVK